MSHHLRNSLEDKIDVSYINNSNSSACNSIDSNSSNNTATLRVKEQQQWRHRFNSYPPFHGIRNNTLFSEEIQSEAPCVPSSPSGFGQCAVLLVIFLNIADVTGMYPICRYTEESLASFAPKSVRQLIKNFKNSSVTFLDPLDINENSQTALDFALFHRNHMSHCRIPYTVGQKINRPDVYLVGSFYSIVDAPASGVKWQQQ